MKMESSKEVEGLVLCMRRGLRLGGRHVGEEGQLTWLGAPSSTTICPSCLCSPPSPSLGTNRTIGESKTLRFSLKHKPKVPGSAWKFLNPLNSWMAFCHPYCSRVFVISKAALFHNGLVGGETPPNPPGRCPYPPGSALDPLGFAQTHWAAPRPLFRGLHPRAPALLFSFFSFANRRGLTASANGVGLRP